jgi:hypothetical protein
MSLHLEQIGANVALAQQKFLDAVEAVIAGQRELDRFELACDECGHRFRPSSAPSTERRLAKRPASGAPAGGSGLTPDG